MRIVLTLVTLSLLVTACDRHSADLQQQVAGSWFQGPHILTLAPDGSYTSIFPGNHAITYKAKWHIESGFLVVTDVRSNSVPMAGNTTLKIVLVDRHHLVLALGTNGISMTR